MCSCVVISMSGNEGWKEREKVVSVHSAARTRALPRRVVNATVVWLLVKENDLLRSCWTDWWKTTLRQKNDFTSVIAAIATYKK